MKRLTLTGLLILAVLTLVWASSLLLGSWSEPEAALTLLSGEGARTATATAVIAAGGTTSSVVDLRGRWS